MSKKRGNRRRSIATLAELFDQVAPDATDEAREELRAVGVDPSAVAGRLVHVALRSIKERTLRELSNASRVLIHRGLDVDLTNKLN